MRHRLMHVALMSMLLFACQAPSERTMSPAKTSALAIDQAMAGIAHRDLWPDFDPSSMPLAIFDGQHTYLLRHPKPPADYQPLPTHPGVYIKQGRDQAITANTHAELGGVSTATLMLDVATSSTSSSDLAAVAVHEAFHVYQNTHHPEWFGNEVDLFTYPVDDARLLALRRIESASLRRALDATSDDERDCWARGALAARKQRYDDMAPEFSAYERGTELNEGLATYVQHRASASNNVELDATDYPPQDIRQRAYASGAAIAFLLDHAQPEWRASLNSNDKQQLDDMLKAAIGTGRACLLDADQQSAITRQAGHDVATLVQSRNARADAFNAMPGWRLRVIAAADEPLWPQGFDPLNVERLDVARILHSRFVKLGNDAGSLEVLGKPAITWTAGSHPLFQGISRAEIAGLTKPSLQVKGKHITLNGDGISINASNAKVHWEGQTVVITFEAGK